MSLEEILCIRGICQEVLDKLNINEILDLSLISKQFNKILNPHILILKKFWTQCELCSDVCCPQYAMMNNKIVPICYACQFNYVFDSCVECSFIRPKNEFIIENACVTEYCCSKVVCAKLCLFFCYKCMRNIPPYDLKSIHKIKLHPARFLCDDCYSGEVEHAIQAWHSIQKEVRKYPRS